MGFLGALKKIPIIGQVVSAGEGMVNIVSAGIKVLNGIIKTFDRFPANLICGIIVIILTVIYELIKIDIIGYTAVFFVYVIPFLARLAWINLRYFYFVLVTKIVESMDPEKGSDIDTSDGQIRAGSTFRKFLIFIQTCHPDPRQWYTYPQNHFGNTHEVRLALACMNPCNSKYIPYFGGLLCKKADRRLPRYCPRAMIMRSLEGLDVDGPKNFVRSDYSKKYHEACDAQNPPKTLFEKKFGAFETAGEVLTRGVCQQSKILLDDPEEVSHACHDTYCKRGDRHPFCSRIDPLYKDLVENNPVQLLKIPALLVLGALLLQIARYYMYDTQLMLVSSEYDMMRDKTMFQQ